MAIDVTGLTYCGKEFGEIFSRDMLSLDVRSLGITYMDNVKGKQKIYTGEISDLFQPYDCTFSPKGGVSLAESYIEPVALKAQLEACYDELWPTYLVEEMEISLKGGLPRTFEEFFFQKYRQKAAKEYMEILFQGDTDYTGQTKSYLSVTDGVEKILTDATGATHITGAAITVDNVLAQVEAVIMAGMDAAAAGEYTTDGYKVLLNPADYNILKVALGKLCCGNSTSDRFSNYGKTADGGIQVYGYDVRPAYVKKNTIIFGNMAAIVLGYDSFDSNLEWDFIDMRKTLGTNSFRINALTNIAVAVVWPESFTISKP